MPSTLVLVEDHGLLAETVSAALRARGLEVRVVDVRATDDVVASVVADEPDLCLLDLDLGTGHDALAYLEQLTDRGLAVLIVTGVTDPVRLARCVRAGAVGIVGKGLAFDTLIEGIERTLERGTLLTAHEREQHLAHLRAHEAGERERLASFDALTTREGEVLRSLCGGATVDRIAAEDEVSILTVRSQVRAILRKLGVNSQLAATALARQSGWLDGDA